MKKFALITALVSSKLFAGLPGDIIVDLPVMNIQVPSNYVCWTSQQAFNIEMDNSEVVSMTMQYINWGGDVLEGEPAITPAGVPVINPIPETELGSVAMNLLPMGQVVGGFDPGIADATINYQIILPGVILTDDVTSFEFETTLISSFQGAWGFLPPDAQIPAGPSISNTVETVSCIANL